MLRKKANEADADTPQKSPKFCEKEKSYKLLL
jgi:hypothetical protein